VEFSTLVQFSKLVSDSSSSEGVFSLLAQTVVHECGTFHALVFGTTDSGDFTLLSSYGGCDVNPSDLDLNGVWSVGGLRTAVMDLCGYGGFGFRAFPLISAAGLFGALIAVYKEADPPNDAQWTLVEGLTELTAISLNKTYQHQKLQKAFDDLRLSQEALVRSEKFRALGQMSAGIAHDLKNLFNPLLLYTDMLREAADDSNEVLQIAERVDRILVRGVETVERLRDFSRQAPEETGDVSTELNRMVQEATEICKPRLSNIQLVLEMGSPPALMIRPADCVTAIVNLILNAVDALEGSGVITIRTGSSTDRAWVEVEDDGPGMTPEIRTRILEPFFTTKGESGTGLGVPIVYAFTQRYGGGLDIASDAGHGATFRMWFPLR
jgi:signal transduction histidine kinase